MSSSDCRVKKKQWSLGLLLKACLISKAVTDWPAGSFLTQSKQGSDETLYLAGLHPTLDPIIPMK